MTDYGETSTGFRGKTFAEARADLAARLRARISPSLTLDEKDWLGNAVDIFSDIEALVWEALEVARNQFDPDNVEGPAAVSLAALTGTIQHEATKGTVSVTLGLDASKTFIAGALVAHVSGQPNNRWVNRDVVTSTTAGNYGAVFVAETAGAYAALAGQLTVIAQTASGWNSITNAADATVGNDIETIPDLMLRRESELSSSGAGTVLAIHEKVSAVSGVIETKVIYNDTNATVGSLPAHNIRVIVWDGAPAQANDDDLAQAIFDSKSAGAPTFGIMSGDAINIYGDPSSCNFDRALTLTSYIAVTVQAPIGTNTTTLTTDIKASIVGLWPNKIGVSVYASKLMLGPAALDAVINVTSLTVGNTPSPVSTSLTPSPTMILLLDSTNIAVTVNLI